MRPAPGADRVTRTAQALRANFPVNRKVPVDVRTVPGIIVAPSA